MSFRPSSRTSASSTSSGSSTRTCREKCLPDFAAVHTLVYFCGRDPRKVKAMRVYETVYPDNYDTLDYSETRSSASSSKRSIQPGLSWVSGGGSNCGRTTQEFYFVESRSGGYRSGAGYKGGEQQQPALVAAVKQWKPPKRGSEKASRPSKRPSKSGGSYSRHGHGHGHRGRQGPPSVKSEADEGEDEEEETDDGSGGSFNESSHQGGGPRGPRASPSPFPPGSPGMMTPPPTSHPSTGRYPGYHQQQPMYNMGGVGGMGLSPPPMPPMTPHGRGGFHVPPHMPTPRTHPPMMSGGGGGGGEGGGRGAHFQ